MVKLSHKMRKFYLLDIADEALFKNKLLALSATISPFCSLESNNYPNYPYAHFGSMVAIGSIKEFNYAENNLLEKWGDFQRNANDWIFGFFTYDIKNQIEPALDSNNFDNLHFPDCHFFIPKYLVSFYEGKISLGVINQHEVSEFLALIDEKNQTLIDEKNVELNIKTRIPKQEYIEKVEQLRNHILNGDIYEINFCMELFAENVQIDPIQTFKHLCHFSKAPFSAFYRLNELSLSCSSPERFLKKEKNKLISQPIKGTIKRGRNIAEDDMFKNTLLNDEKERAENVMIVDLVRNDLAKLSKNNEVVVEELFGIYSFETVHQMISTITTNIHNNLPIENIIKATFPMGSMTGAPKINAMKLAEKYEATKRGLYSGTVGYITPQGNFDFNVVIRSILYNQHTKYLSMQVGSAITYDCNATKEYEECLLKANGLLKALHASLTT